MRKLAICARVTAVLGQYRNGSVPQPEVIPAANNASMLTACTLKESTSTNPAGNCST